MKRLKQFKWSLLVLIVHIAIMTVFAVILPRNASVPTHWNFVGEIDGWASKPMALFFFLGINIFLFLMMFFMPFYSPWYHKNEERFERIIPYLTTILVLFFALIAALSMYIAKTASTDSPTMSINILMLLIGFMFISLGNLMPKMPKNFFIGIRTPWTIASDEVWTRTHRVGGKAFVVSGVLFALKGVILTDSAIFQTAIMGTAFIVLMFPILYSFFIYKKLGN